MTTSRAIFVPLSSLCGQAGSMVSASVLEMLRDFAALGYRLLVVTDHLELGGRSFDRCADLLAELRGERGQRYNAPFTDVILVKNGFDPGPFWDAARRFNLSLSSSMLIDHRGDYLVAAQNAGLGRVEPHREVFGLAA